jgi:hypothetical protein
MAARGAAWLDEGEVMAGVMNRMMARMMARVFIRKAAVCHGAGFAAFDLRQHKK